MLDLPFQKNALNVIIADLSGKIVTNAANVNSISVAKFLSGIYIVTYTYDNLI